MLPPVDFDRGPPIRRTRCACARLNCFGWRRSPLSRRRCSQAAAAAFTRSTSTPNAQRTAKASPGTASRRCHGTSCSLSLRAATSIHNVCCSSFRRSGCPSLCTSQSTEPQPQPAHSHHPHPKCHPRPRQVPKGGRPLQQYYRCAVRLVPQARCERAHDGAQPGPRVHRLSSIHRGAAMVGAYVGCRPGLPGLASQPATP